MVHKVIYKPHKHLSLDSGTWDQEGSAPGECFATFFYVIFLFYFIFHRYLMKKFVFSSVKSTDLKDNLLVVILFLFLLLCFIFLSLLCLFNNNNSIIFYIKILKLIICYVCSIITIALFFI